MSRTKSAIYLYQGDDHPVVGLIHGAWDSWRSTLKGRWYELALVADDYQYLYGGTITLVVTDQGLTGARQVDGYDDTYSFDVEGSPRRPDGDEKTQFLRQYMAVSRWIRDHSQ